MRKEYYLAHREECLAKNRAWKSENKDKLKAWEKENREKRTEQKREWARANKDKRNKGNKEYRQNHREKMALQCREWRNKNPEKLIHWIIFQAIKRHGFQRQRVCQNCNSSQSILAHHPDYTKPLYVIWLCRSCHTSYHRTLGFRLRAFGKEPK